MYLYVIPIFHIFCCYSDQYTHDIPVRLCTVCDTCTILGYIGIYKTT